MKYPPDGTVRTESGPVLTRARRAIRRLAPVSLVALLSWIAGPVLAGESADIPPRSVEKAAAAIEYRFDDIGVAQASYAVIRGDEELIAGYGRATADTPFIIASVSKSFTALAILQLVEDGLVGLDSPVAEYLPDFSTSDASNPITVRQLLVQTSGLSTLDGVRDAFSPEVSLDERVRSIRGFTLTSAPGAEFHYSNLNYATLGLIVETVTGLDYGEYIQAEILEPLDMNHTYSDFGLAEANGLATGTISVFGLPVELAPTPFPGLVPDGYLISTAADMARYARFQMSDGSINGHQLLSAKSMALMHAPAFATEGGQHLDHYAMGWRTGTINGEDLIAHDGNTFGYHTDVAVLPESDIAVVVLVARSGMSVTRLEVPALETLAGGASGQSRTSTISWIVLDVIAALVVLGTIVSVVRRRRRRHTVPRPLPRRWPALLQIVAGLLVGVAVVILAGSLAGGIDPITFRLLWGLAPDVLIVAFVFPLLLTAAGITTLLERRAVMKSLRMSTQ